MASPTIDTMSISDVSYENGELTLKITTGYSMKNADFTITPTGKTPIVVTRGGYLSNPYTLTLTTSGVAAGDTCTIDATYMDGADSGTSLMASANFTIPAPVVTTAELNVSVGKTAVTYNSSSSDPTLSVRYKIYADAAKTNLITRTMPHTVGEALTAQYDGSVTYDAGHTYYVDLCDATTETTIYDSMSFTVPHYTTKVFKEWQKDGATYDFSTPVKADITLVGVWKEAYKVTFKDYDGTTLSSQTVVEDSATGLIMPNDPTRSGYTFAGWECSLDGHIWNNASESVLSEMTLTATYTQN